MMDLLSKVRPPSVDLSSVSGNLPAVSLPGVNLPGVNFLSSGNAPELPVTDYVAQILLKTDPSDLPPSNPEVKIKLLCYYLVDLFIALQFK